MTEEMSDKYIQLIFIAWFKKRFSTIAEVEDFSKESKIPIDTLRDIFYKDKVGLGTINRVLKETVELNPEKVEHIIELINSSKPLNHSQKIWNSIKASESEKSYYALAAKSLWELDKKLEKTRSSKTQKN